MNAARLDEIPAFDDQGALRVVVEAAAGTRNKLKYSSALGVLELHHVLPAGMAFPRDFGFIPSTLGGDGDPLDALVFADESLPPGTLVACRLIGVIQATQARQGAKESRNDRFLAVARQSHQYRQWRDLQDVPQQLLDELERFFVFYNEERAVTFKPQGRLGAREAMALLQEGRALHQTGQAAH